MFWECGISRSFATKYVELRQNETDAYETGHYFTMSNSCRFRHWNPIINIFPIAAAVGKQRFLLKKNRKAGMEDNNGAD